MSPMHPRAPPCAPVHPRAPPHQVRAYRAGDEVRAHAYMLIEGGGEHGRYLALSKDFQLCFQGADDA